MGKVVLEVSYMYLYKPISVGKNQCQVLKVEFKQFKIIFQLENLNPQTIDKEIKEKNFTLILQTKKLSISAWNMILSLNLTIHVKMVHLH